MNQLNSSVVENFIETQNQSLWIQHLLSSSPQLYTVNGGKEQKVCSIYKSWDPNTGLGSFYYYPKIKRNRKKNNRHYQLLCRFLGNLLSLCNDLLKSSNHIKWLLWKVIIFPIQNTLQLIAQNHIYLLAYEKNRTLTWKDEQIKQLRLVKHL